MRLVVAHEIDAQSLFESLPLAKLGPLHIIFIAVTIALIWRAPEIIRMMNARHEINRKYKLEEEKLERKNKRLEQKRARKRVTE